MSVAQLIFLKDGQFTGTNLRKTSMVINTYKHLGINMVLIVFYLRWPYYAPAKICCFTNNFLLMCLSQSTTNGLLPRLT